MMQLYSILHSTNSSTYKYQRKNIHNTLKIHKKVQIFYQQKTMCSIIGKIKLGT